jgi:hypothetical protein
MGKILEIAAVSGYVLSGQAKPVDNVMQEHKKRGALLQRDADSRRLEAQRWQGQAMISRRAMCA